MYEGGLGCKLRGLRHIGITCPIIGIRLRILHDKSYDDRMIGLVRKDEVDQEMSKAFFNIFPLSYIKIKGGREDGYVDR